MKALLFAVVCSMCVIAQTKPAQTSAPPAKKAASSSGNPRLLTPSLFRAKAPDLYRVKFSTTKGDFTVEVNRANAPLGADRFYNLVRGGFFTGVSFYRVIPNVFVQFGISPSPAITKAWSAAPIHDDPLKLGNKPGSLVFANAGPNTRTTQLFINIGDNSSSLDSQGFAAFGMVTEGMDVVKTLYGGYGEMQEQPGGHGPSQELATKQGKAYLEKNFPNLDSIKSAAVVFPEPAAAPAKAPPKAPAKSAAPKK